MYLDFVLLILDYFRTLSLRVFLYEFVTPLIISVWIGIYVYLGNSVISTVDFSSDVLTLLGVLVGFSITVITILTTSSSENLNKMKDKKTNYVIGGVNVSLFRFLLINFTYSVVLEIGLIIFFLLCPIVLKNHTFCFEFKVTIFSFALVTLLHLLFLTMRNLTDFYLVVTKE